MEYRQARWEEPLVYEQGDPARGGYLVPQPSERIKRRVGPPRIPEKAARGEAPRIPGMSEVEVVRHYTRLAEMSYGVDSGPVPLGSCTMKYNPRIAARYAYHPRLEMLHPLLDEELVQGVLEAMYRVQEWLKHILGMDTCSLHPAAGAHGELAGVYAMYWYHKLRGRLGEKREVIVPDSAHGTNPASAAMAGFRVVEVPTASDGNVDMEALRSVVSSATAGFMITNPSTLGLFEENILEISRVIHSVDGLMYYDGANLNGILGHARPGDMGFDLAHVNLHKTFSSPHGGGGPGAGPVCARNIEVIGDIRLGDLLPGPRIVYRRGEYRLEWPSYGPVMIRAWQANTSVVLWSYVYMLSLGARGLRLAGELSVVNTNYFIARLRELSRYYEVPYAPGRARKHEVVVSAKPLKRQTGATAEDVAKGLLDAGLYAPTIYFPLIVEEALMFEFTESETRENIDRYVERLREIAEAAERGEPYRDWPLNTAARRVDLKEANHPKTITPTWRVKERRERGEIGPLR